MEDDYMMVIIPCIVEIAASDTPERVKKLRLGAVSELQRYLHYYRQLGYMPKLLYPHITLPLPDGTHLRAVAYADTTYPAINLYLLRDGEPEELVCFAEYNSEHSPCHELCIGVYTSDAEDTQYYGPYRPERETEYGKDD